MSDNLRKSLTISKAASENVTDTAKVLDKTWEQIQKKTFTNWINNQLKVCDVAPIVDLATDFSNGEKLILLLQIIGDESLGKMNRNPRMRLQKIENCNIALNFIKRRGVQLTNIGSEDIVDCNEKLILGLVWTIILRFSISTISEEGLTAKEGLLLWCQRKTQPYEADFKKKKHANTQLAFDVAEKHLGIPKLFAVEDIVDVIRPDERSVMTYVAQYFHAFSALNKFDTAGRRVGALGNLLQNVWDMQNDYERRVKLLINSVHQIQSTWGQTNFNGYMAAKKELIGFETYKGTTKREWVTERRELDSLLGNIQTKLKTYNLRPYVPPVALNLENLNLHWQTLLQAEAARKRALTSFIKAAKDALCQKFAKAANDFQSQLNNCSLGVAALQGELETQLQSAQKLLSQTGPLSQQLESLAAIDAECVQANIEDNEYTIFTVEDLSFELGILSQTLIKKIAFIENQVIARTKSNITPEQMEQFSETFRLFDKDNSNGLIRDEFKAALQSEGTAVNEKDFEETFLKISQGNNEINFEQFIEYARNLQEDKLNLEHLTVSFKTLAEDRPYVTEADMYRGGLSSQVVEYLKSQLPKKEEGYDYNQFLGSVFI
ncbi:hypothetical protein HDV02_006095 [Globomyces sp. JEL0801]|nr:hypothetical protein HDV02_006095 [Globomyces sp. JEL0801]